MIPPANILLLRQSFYSVRLALRKVSFRRIRARLLRDRRAPISAFTANRHRQSRLLHLLVNAGANGHFPLE